MHVGVKIAVAQRVAEEQLQHPLAEPHQIMPGGAQRLDIAQRDAIDPIERHHAARRQIPMRARRGETCIIRGICAKLERRRRLHPQIQLAQHHAFEMRNHIRRAQAARRRRDQLDQPRGKVKSIEVFLKSPLDAGAQHLDRNLCAGVDTTRRMHLRDRGGSDGLGKFGKHRVNRLAQRRRNRSLGLSHRKRRQAVLQHGQLFGKLNPHHIGPRRKHLAKLDVSRAKCGQRPRHRRQGRVAFQPQPSEGPAQHPGHKPQPRRHVHRFKCHLHGARAFKRGAGDDQPPEVVRAAHLRLSSPNAAPQCPCSGCGISPAQSLPHGSSAQSFPDRETCGSIRQGIGSCHGHSRPARPRAESH